MSSTKFTEGSWRVEWAEDGNGDKFFNVLKNDGDADDYGRMVDASYSIIEMAYGVLENDDENRANANLIAAAPDLYVALELLVTEVTRGHSQGQDERSLRTLARNAASALAYARGERYHYGEDEEWGPDSATQQLERGPR